MPARRREAPTRKVLLMKRRLELETLEERRLLTASLHPLMPLGNVARHPPAVGVMADAAPGSAIAIVELPGHPSAAPALAHGGFRVNHNQTLLRVRRHKGRCR